MKLKLGETRQIKLALTITIFFIALLPFGELNAKVFGSFKGLDAPFLSSKYPEFSPLLGIDSEQLSELRCHNAKLLPIEEDMPIGFDRPTANCRGNGLQPGDYTSALLERLFPSPAGLKANDILSDPINRYNWLTPKKVAQILIATTDYQFFGNAEQSIAVLVNILLGRDKSLRFDTDTDSESNNRIALKQNKIEKLERRKTRDAQRNNDSSGQWYDGQIAKLKMQINNLKPITSDNDSDATLRAKENQFRIEREAKKLAKIIYGAFIENKSDHDSQIKEHSAYPKDIVPRIFVTWMWKKHSIPKANLRPYYIEMVNANIIDKVLVAKIIWDGPESFYTREEFRGQFGKTGIFTSRKTQKLIEREVSLMQKQQNKVPYLPYGTAYLKNSNVEISSSDCGESLVLSTFLIALYDPESMTFSWQKLLKRRNDKHPLRHETALTINEELIDFFRDFCQTPEDLADPRVRDEWARLVSNLNKDRKRPRIHYLNKVGDFEYGIGPGAENALLVILKLLGAPEAATPGITRKELLDCMCELFSPDQARISLRLRQSIVKRWNWEILPFQGVALRPDDFRLQKLTSKATQSDFVTIRFYQFIDDGNKEGHKEFVVENLFYWHCQPTHFDFLPVQADENKKIKSETSWKKLTPLHPKHTLSELVFNLNLGTAMGKIQAIKTILGYRDLSGVKHNFGPLENLVERWVCPDGKYFADWRDKHTNLQLFNVLQDHWTLHDFLNRNLHGLYPNLFEAYFRKSDEVGLALILDKDMARITKYTGSPEKLEEYRRSDGVLIFVISNIHNNDTGIKLLHAIGVDHYLNFLKGDGHDLNEIIKDNEEQDKIEIYSY